MHPIDQVRCSCLRREPITKAPLTSQQLAEQLEQAFGERMREPEVQKLVERAVAVVRKRET